MLSSGPFRPLRIGKLVVVQLFQLAAEVSNQFILGMQRQIDITLLAQQPDKLFFQFRLALVAVRAFFHRLVGGDHGVFSCGGDDVEIGFNNKYLTDALRVADTDEVNFKLNGPVSPIIILPPEGDSFLFLVLPVRIKTE